MVNAGIDLSSYFTVPAQPGVLQWVVIVIHFFLPALPLSVPPAAAEAGAPDFQMGIFAAACITLTSAATALAAVCTSCTTA